eukprot:CAMPEP_0172317276 /NCGR_PEP_ID=MMETSP1058-20130122/31129_1 /TAXON_ID=83371 /ORGANISM="Detonula confervacea, Strain CCMP 353" /LENGTH=673 /DNA_ID=CAMNT_0013031797 /DNA_START=8 /DNA_END=2029 /DNA_ORIENTATION=+
MSTRKALCRGRTLSLTLILACVAFVGIIIAQSFYHSINDPHQNHNHVTQNHTHHSHDNNNLSSTNTAATCLRITSALNVTAWPGVIYHKDMNTSNPMIYDSDFFSSVEEDDRHARLTIDQFNEMRSSVLTPHLINAGFQSGGGYPTRTFAKRLMQQTLMEKEPSRPLLIVVFGNSFTIGSNCGESSSQMDEDCAWPGRLAQRWEKIVGSTLLSPAKIKITWRMFQENAQSSLNIAQKLPAIIDEFRAKNVTPDAILLDNTITDRLISVNRPWFEAVVRVLVQSFPGTVIVSLEDAIPSFVNVTNANDRVKQFIRGLHQVQRQYGLTVVNIAKMVRLLHHKNENNTQLNPIDLLWPQSTHMSSFSGLKLDDLVTRQQGLDPVYWANFLPKVQKTKHAYNPQNHPPWPTHQYVADAVMYALLRVLQTGLGCNSDGDGEMMDPSLFSRPYYPETTVAPKEEIDACFICQSPLDQINAKSTCYTDKNITNFTNNTGKNNNAMPESKKDANNEVVVTCGDWKWTTDKRNRSGWQSDQFRSIIRFRLKVSNTPTILLTYMRSHELFGKLRVTFRPVTKGHQEEEPLGCEDVDNLHNETLIPSLILGGSIPKFSLWETAVFPFKLENHDVKSKDTWKLLNQTVLSRMTGDNDVEYVDVYVENPNEFGAQKRIKIQVLISC